MRLLSDLGLSHHVVISDVNKLLENENPELENSALDGKQASAGHRLTWQRYHRYAGEQHDNI